MASFTYDAPGTTPKDTVRFLIQDTDPHGTGEWVVSDEEIQWAYDTWFPLYQSEHWVAAAVADNIAARYAREASYSADGVSVSLGPVGDQYRMLAASLREQYRAMRAGAEPSVGGITPDEQMDPFTKPFAFGKGIHDNVEAGPQEYGGVYPPDQTVESQNVPESERLVEP